MNARPQNEPKPVRLVFELARADNPRLYDELGPVNTSEVHQRRGRS